MIMRAVALAMVTLCLTTSGACLIAALAFLAQTQFAMFGVSVYGFIMFGALGCLSVALRNDTLYYYPRKAR